MTTTASGRGARNRLSGPSPGLIEPINWRTQVSRAYSASLSAVRSSVSTMLTSPAEGRSWVSPRTTDEDWKQCPKRHLT